jgi:hypothetical protein
MNWISTKDRLPSTDDTVIFVSNNEVMVGFLDIYNNQYFEDIETRDLYGDCMAYHISNVPYWMPLPQPPEQEKP